MTIKDCFPFSLRPHCELWAGCEEISGTAMYLQQWTIRKGHAIRNGTHFKIFLQKIHRMNSTIPTNVSPHISSPKLLSEIWHYVMSDFIRSCPMTFALASFGAMLLRHETHSENFVSYPNKYTTYTVYLSLITFIWCFRSVCIFKYSTTKTMVPLCSQSKWCDHALNNYVNTWT